MYEKDTAKIVPISITGCLQDGWQWAKVRKKEKRREKE
jgi:hypothetical protein